MYRILSCLAVEHDWRLVLLAGVLCFLASLTAITLFFRAQGARGRSRVVWIGAGRCSRPVMMLISSSVQSCSSPSASVTSGSIRRRMCVQVCGATGRRWL